MHYSYTSDCEDVSLKTRSNLKLLSLPIMIYWLLGTSMQMRSWLTS